jgi:glutamyl-Q tRNA(Asp) synthetase
MPLPPQTTRFAPSPTGYLHLGHAYAAWQAWRRARDYGGKFLLRIEDIDPARCRPEYTQAIIEDLTWLGLEWDGEILIQSTRLALYQSCLTTLFARGLLYPCFCSRADIAREIAASASAPHAPDGAPLYPGTCRRLSEDERTSRLTSGAPHAWRLDTTRALQGAPPLYFTEEGIGQIPARPQNFGDIILARRDAPASYHLCATHDDAAQSITLVTRGHDLRDATHVHRLLQHLMDWPVPAYAHHALMRGAEGRRLAKRDGAETLRALRAAGTSATEITARFLTILPTCE